MRVHTLAVLAALATLLAPASTAFAQPRQGDVAWHHQRAQEALQRQDIAAAAKEFQAIVDLRPDLPRARSNLGLMYHLQREYEPAIEQFREALRLDPKLASASMFLGIDYYLVSRPRLAIENLERALSLDPRSAPARKWLAMSYLLAGDPHRAASELKNARRLDPSDHELGFHLGRAYLKVSQLAFLTLRSYGAESPWFFLFRGRQFEHQNKPAEAVAEFQHAARTDAKFPGVHYEIGRALEASGRPAEALEAYLRELRNYRSHAAASAALVGVLIRLGLEEEAKEVGLLAERRHSGNPAVAGILESAYLKASAASRPTGDQPLDESAIGEFLREERELAGKSSGPSSWAERARDAILGANPAQALRVAESPDSGKQKRGSKYWKARAFLELGRLGEALAAFAALQGPDGGSPELAYYIQICAEQLGFRTLESFAAAEPSSYRAHQLRAEYHAAREESAKAIAEYRKALQLRPGAALIYLAIGELHLRDRDYDSALAAFGAELKNDPYSVAALTGAGEVYATREQPEKAEELLLKAVKINPNSIAARKALGKVFYTQGDYSKAVEHLQSAIDSGAGEDETVYYQLGRAFLKLGDREQARENLAIVKKLQNAKRRKVQERIEGSLREQSSSPHFSPADGPSSR